MTTGGTLVVATVLVGAALALLLIPRIAAKRRTGPGKDARGRSRTAIVLGSGGHTAEMLRALKELPLAQFQPRTYIIAGNDTLSDDAAKSFEAAGSAKNSKTGEFRVERIPRARNVGQSYLTSIPSTFQALWTAWRVVAHTNPHLIVCNGPGTCVPVIAAAVAQRALGLGSGARIVYLESLARVSSLSLSCRLVYPFADRVIVQWRPPEALARRYPRLEYAGRVV